eukprot:m.45957 g.45957  ORF g.45957 m.45957 type:complete len:364 (+) comp15148_c0_seq9:302-1393(+)
MGHWIRKHNQFSAIVGILGTATILLLGYGVSAGIVESAKDNYPLIITAANWGYRAALINFICLLHKLGLLQRYHVVVLTFDNETASMVRKDFADLVEQADSPAVIPMAATDDGLGASHFGAKDWNSVTSRKLSGVLTKLKSGRDIVFIDVDIAVARDPIPAILHEFAMMESPAEQRPDFVFQVNNQDPPPCASVEDPVGRKQAEPSYRAVTGTKEINSGFYFLRSNTKTIAWLTAAITECASNNIDDQEGFIRALSTLLRSKKAAFSPDCNSFTKDHTQAMRVCVFDECEFPTGWATGRYPKRGDPAIENNWKWMQEPTTQPYLFHPNYITGLQNKIGRLSQKGLWVAEQSECNPWHLRRSNP